MEYKELYNLMSPEKYHGFMQVLCVMYFPENDSAFVIDVNHENTFFIDNCTDKIRTGILVKVNRLALLKIGTAAFKRELKLKERLEELDDDRRRIP